MRTKTYALRCAIRLFGSMNDSRGGLAMRVRLGTCERLLMATQLREAASLSGSKATWQFLQNEQISFLRHLYRNELPFRVEHQRLVKDVMVNEAGRDWILRAKTGWSGKVGWWVGWVEWPTGPVFFALNIDTPNRLNDLSKRQEITRSILRSINALPPS